MSKEDSLARYQKHLKRMIIKAIRRLGKSPWELGESSRRPSCPDILEAEDGNFIVIGKDISDQIDLTLTNAVLSDNERAVLVPRSIFIHARKDIPTE